MFVYVFVYVMLILILTGELNSHYKLDDYAGTGPNPKHDPPPPPSQCYFLTFLYFNQLLMLIYSDF